MIRIEDTRFGLIEVEDGSLISLPHGLIGFEGSTDFVLLERTAGHATIAVLQSVQVPSLAFPVMDAGLFGPTYPDPSPAQIARDAGFGDEDVAMLVIVAADRRRQCLEVNLLAPLIIDLGTRQGAQILLDPERYSTRFSLSADEHEKPLPRIDTKQPRTTLRPATMLAAAMAL